MTKTLEYQLIQYNADAFDKGQWLNEWNNHLSDIKTFHPSINSIDEYFKRTENQLTNPDEQLEAGFKTIFLLTPVLVEKP